MSALPPKADIGTQPRDVKSGHCAASFDYLVSAHKERLGDLQAYRLCGLQIYNQLKLDRHLYWKIGRLCPTKNLVDVACGLAIRIGRNVSIGDETAALGKVTEGVDRR